MMRKQLHEGGDGFQAEDEGEALEDADEDAAGTLDKGAGKESRNRMLCAG